MRRLLATIFILALGAGATAAGAEPHVTDACGDADAMARVGDAVVVPTPDGPRANGFDIEAVWFEDYIDDNGRQGGVRVNLQTCADVAPPDPTGGTWSVGWMVSQTCGRQVAMFDSPTALSGIVRRASLTAFCSRPGLLPGSSEIYTEWTMSLPAEAFGVNADVVTWALTPGLVTEELGSRLAFLSPGSVWSSPSAFTRDGRQVTVTSFGQPIGLYASGPGAMDEAEGTGSFTVGA